MARSSTKTPPHSITALLTRAKAHIAAGEHRLRLAAHDIATASEQGATQRAIAAGVGKSVGWVNGLLQWHRSGYLADSPFGPAVAASRERADRAELAEAEAAAAKAAACSVTEQARPAPDMPETISEVERERVRKTLDDHAVKMKAEAAARRQKTQVHVPDLPASLPPQAPAPEKPVLDFKSALGAVGQVFEDLVNKAPVGDELGEYASEESQRLLMVSAIENVKLSSIGDVWPKVIADVGPDNFRCFIQVLKDAYLNYCEAERDRAAAERPAAKPASSAPADDFPDLPAFLDRRLH